MDPWDIAGGVLIVAGAAALAWGALTMPRRRSAMPFAAFLLAAFALCLGLALLLSPRLSGPEAHQGAAPRAAAVQAATATPAPPPEATAAPSPEPAPLPVVVIPPTDAPAPPVPSAEPPDGGQPQTASRQRAKALNTQGYRAYRRGDYRQAHRLYQEATREDPGYDLAWYNLACMEALRGDSTQTLQALARYRDLKPSDDLLARIQGDEDFEMLRRDADFLRRLALLEGAQPPPAPGPGAAPTRPALAQVQPSPSLQGADFLPGESAQQALRRFQEETRRRASDPAAWLGLARAHAQRGDQHGAVQALRRYRALRPGGDIILTLSEDDHFASVWRSAWFQGQLRRLARTPTGSP